jgi:hypothetical protein
VVNVAASINHVRLVGRLNRGDKLGQPSAPAIVVALTLAFLGFGLAAYLVLIR